jgi:hypothetical protein
MAAQRGHGFSRLCRLRRSNSLLWESLWESGFAGREPSLGRTSLRITSPPFMTKLHAVHLSYVCERIARYGDDVGEFAAIDAADLAGPVVVQSAALH